MKTPSKIDEDFEREIVDSIRYVRETTRAAREAGEETVGGHSFDVAEAEVATLNRVLQTFRARGNGPAEITITRRQIDEAFVAVDLAVRAIKPEALPGFDDLVNARNRLREIADVFNRSRIVVLVQPEPDTGNPKLPLHDDPTRNGNVAEPIRSFLNSLTRGGDQ